MTATYPYNTERDPPAPTLPVRVAAPGIADMSVMVPAIVDTGADITVIAAPIASQLDLPAVGEIVVAGFGGTERAHALHAAEIELDGTMDVFEVIVGAETLIGRDILNRLVVTLDGPQQRIRIR